MNALPGWLVRTIVTALVTALFGVILAWGANLSGKAEKHETRISVLEDHQEGIDKSLKSIDSKLDRLIERRR
jgi:hypothetical protein